MPWRYIGFFLLEFRLLLLGFDIENGLYIFEVRYWNVLAFVNFVINPNFLFFAILYLP